MWRAETKLDAKSHSILCCSNVVCPQPKARSAVRVWGGVQARRIPGSRSRTPSDTEFLRGCTHWQALSSEAPSHQLPLLRSLQATRSWLRTGFCLAWPQWEKGRRGSQVPFLGMRNQLLLPLAPCGFGGKFVQIPSVSPHHVVIPPGHRHLLLATSLPALEREKCRNGQCLCCSFLMLFFRVWPYPFVCVAFLRVQMVHLLDRKHLATYLGFTAYA